MFTRYAKRAILFADQRVLRNLEGFSGNGKCSLTNGGGHPGLIIMNAPRGHLVNTNVDWRDKLSARFGGFTP